jgi:hypothetical protein
MATVFNESATGGGFGGGGWGGIPYPFPVGNFGGGNSDGIGGLVGLAIAASLFGGRGFGGGHDHGHPCPDGRGRGSDGEGTAALAAVIAALNNRNEPDKCEAFAAAVIAKLGTLEGQIPEANCELLLALQSAVGSLTAQGTANAQALSTQLNQIQLGQLVQSNAIQSQITTVNTNVAFQGSETRQAVAASTTAILTALKDQEVNGLRDRNISLDNKVTELLSDARHNEHRRELDGIRINIENNNTAIAAQAQFQQQRQSDLTFARIERDNHDLRCQIADLLQVARSTQSNILVGNTGVTTTGPQTANPTNVNQR